VSIGVTETLPASWYVDPEILRREHDAIFKRSWQYVGRADQVAEGGFYFAARVGNVPVAVVRDREGILRAFVNVCRHRGHEVVQGEGRRATLQCPYHAWTYGLDGRLRSAPRAEREPAFELDGIALLPIAIEVWGPFVFVNPDPNAAPLAEALGELPDLLSLGSLRFQERVEWEVEANWKVAVENFLECYHCAVAHPGFSKLIDVGPDAYRLAADGPVLSQFGSLRDGAGAGEAQFHLVWPNTTLNVNPGPPNLSIGSALPLGPGRVVRFLDYFFGEEVDEATIAELREFDAQVGREDEALVRSVQRGLESGMIDRGRLLPESEKLVAAFQARVAEALA
jgi:phenylpropionate dioxygenase-like ring-hydroxylating dioxygenase large terminal subunit